MALLNSDIKRGVFIIYLLNSGITNTDIGILQTSLFLAMMVGELPSGLIADKYGRKTAIIFSFIFMIFYGVGYLFFTSFTPFLVMFIINGFAFSLQSGSDQALLYDYLKQRNDQENFIKINSREKAISALAIASSMAIGGWFKDQTSWTTLFIVFIIIKLTGLTFSFLLNESRKVEDMPNNYDGQEKFSVQQFFFSVKGAQLLPLFLGFSLYEAILTPTYIYGQTLLNHANFTLTVIGFTYAAIELSNAILYNFSAYISKKIKFIKLVVFTYFFLSIFIFLLPFSKNYMPIVFYLTLCLPSFVDMIYMDYVNEHYPSAIRASCISVNNFISSAFISLSYIIYGFFIERNGINQTIMFSSIIIVLALCLSLYGLLLINSHKDTKG
jgi:MFS family permease